jgi:F-type H+-transporting ATPase subunit b
VLTAVVTKVGSTVQVALPADFARAAEEEHEVALPEKDLNPIFPEGKEILWGFGSFVVFAILMRFWLFPKLKKGMDARYATIREGHERAQSDREAAQAEVAAYQQALATVRAEANSRIEAARTTLDAERQDRLAVVNAEIAQRRAAAAAEADAARSAAHEQVQAAVASVVTRAAELAVGKRPSADSVASAVAASMSAGVAR